MAETGQDDDELILDILEKSKQFNSNGKFKKGNTMSAKRIIPEDIRKLKGAAREEVLRCALSLCKPWSTLQSDMKKLDCSRLEYITGNAVAKLNYHWIAFLLEQVLGKAKQAESSEGDVKFYIQYDPNKLKGKLNDGEEIIEVNGNE